MGRYACDNNITHTHTHELLWKKKGDQSSKNESFAIWVCQCACVYRYCIGVSTPYDRGTPTISYKLINKQRRMCIYIELVAPGMYLFRLLCDKRVWCAVWSEATHAPCAHIILLFFFAFRLFGRSFSMLSFAVAQCIEPRMLWKIAFGLIQPFCSVFYALSHLTKYIYFIPASHYYPM